MLKFSLEVLLFVEPVAITKSVAGPNGVQLTVSGVLSVVGTAKEFYGELSCWRDS
jgi:hypothetical protein